MDKLVIPFDGKTEIEVDAVPLTTFIGWTRLRRAIDHAIDLDPKENIAGLIIDKTGIAVKIETVEK